jgi:hypothetical protein
VAGRVYDRAVSSRQPHRDIVEEARAVMDAATERAIELRLVGGLAVRLHADDGLHPAFDRLYRDIDVVVSRRAGGDAAKLLSALGYSPNEPFNAMNGNRRLLFYDEPNGRQLDVFVGSFEMCHEIPVADRLSVDPLSLPLAELLLTKLQIVKLNEKDRRDALAIVHHHEVASHDRDAINGDVVAGLLAADWGLWRTTTMNIDRALDGLGDYELDDDLRARLRMRLLSLRERIDSQPKPRKWKLRDRVGDRVRWYEEPEEVD